MSSIAALALYPIWAVALAVGLTALRLGRSTGRGLVILCFALALWVTGLILLSSADDGREGLVSLDVAERVLPFGMLLAGAFLHAGADVAEAHDPRLHRFIRAVYATCAVVAITGAAAPHLLYGPGARGTGPLFYPLAIASVFGVAIVKLTLLRIARRAPLPRRRRAYALLVANFAASLGGGGVVLVRAFDLAPISVAAPFLLLSLLLATYAVIYEEKGRAREVLVQAFAFAALTAVFSAVGLALFFRFLPRLLPEAALAWTAFVLFFAALPLDPLRSIAVETIGARLFARPSAVPILEKALETKEIEREQAEGLAELGRLASAVAHEIRNPLGVIVARLKVLEKKGADPDDVASIRAEVDRAKRFLEDLLRFAKPRPLALREIDVHPVIAMAASNVRQALAIDEIVRVDEPPSPLFIEADRGALLDVATILLTNAAIAVADRPSPEVRVTITSDDDAVTIAVTDNGPGVPPAIEPRLFQLFVTGRGRDHAHPGTGIGLALATRWIQRHGGTLRHERPPEGGARFIARWPRVPITE